MFSLLDGIFDGLHDVLQLHQSGLFEAERVGGAAFRSGDSLRGTFQVVHGGG